MEAVRPHEDDGPGGDPVDAHSDDCDPRHSRVLESLAALLSDGPLADELLDRAIGRLVDAFGLSGATLSRIRESDGVLHVQPVASGGVHAAFARDMSARPLDSLADAATAVSEDRSVFVGDADGLAAVPAEETGVGRWRSSVSTHATGVLPVRAWGRTVGVLTVEWPSSVPLGESERGLLEAAATLLGTVLAALAERDAGVESAAVDAESVTAAAQPSEVVSLLGVTAEGVVVPLAGDGVADLAPALTLSVAMRAGASGEHPIWDVAAVSPRTMVASAGIAIVPGGDAVSLASTVGEAVREYTAQGVSLADVAGYLGHSVRAAAPGGARVSVVMFEIELHGPSAVVTSTSAGAVATILLAPDGRLAVDLSDQPALSDSAVPAPAERHALLLEGDRMALVGGPVAPFGTAEGQAAVRDALQAAGSDATDVARELLGMLSDPHRAGIAVVIGTAEPPSSG